MKRDPFLSLQLAGEYGPFSFFSYIKKKKKALLITDV